MKHFRENIKTYIMLIIHSTILTASLGYIKQEDDSLLWSNGFGMFYLMMLLFGFSMIISLNAKIN